MKTLLPSMVLFCWFWSLPTLAMTRDPDRYFFDQTLGDFSEELQEASIQGKDGILIMFEMEGCPFCHWMRTKILNRVPVQDYFKQHFLIFSVDIEGAVEIIDFKGIQRTQKDFALNEIQVRATPVFVFFDLHGHVVARHTGALATIEEFILLGHFVVDGAYRTGSFTHYKRLHSQTPR